MSILGVWGQVLYMYTRPSLGDREALRAIDYPLIPSPWLQGDTFVLLTHERTLSDHKVQHHSGYLSGQLTVNIPRKRRQFTKHVVKFNGWRVRIGHEENYIDQIGYMYYQSLKIAKECQLDLHSRIEYINNVSRGSFTRTIWTPVRNCLYITINYRIIWKSSNKFT